MDAVAPAIRPADAGHAPCNSCGAASSHALFVKAGYRLVRCDGCGLVFVANPPSPAEVAAFYTDGGDYHQELLDPASPGFARMRGIARQHLSMLSRSVPAGRGLKLLDIGCSTGLFLDEARRAGFTVAGAELSPVTSAFARSHFGLDVHTEDWREAGHAEGSFDVITLFDVIEHLTDPARELREVRRLLKPGGLLLQSTPDIDGLFPRLSYRVARLVDYWPHPEPPHHLFQFSRRTLAQMTAQQGYQIGRADRAMIGLDYSFGTPRSWRISPKLVPYAAVFAPVAVLGWLTGQGDWLYLAARRPAH